jgi:ferritin
LGAKTHEKENTTMIKIGKVNKPNIQGKHPQEALQILCDHCHDNAVQIMQLNNEVFDLKQKVEELELNQR